MTTHKTARTITAKRSVAMPVDASTFSAAPSDQERAAAFHILLTGLREPGLQGKPGAPAAEMLAALHHHLLRAEPLIPVRDHVLEQVNQQIICVLSGQPIGGEEAVWLWDDLLGSGLVADAKHHTGPYCGRELLRFYGLLGAASRDFFGFPVPAAIVFELMAWFAYTKLFRWTETKTATVITTTDEGRRALRLEGSVRVPLRYGPPDGAITLAHEVPLERFEWALRVLSYEEMARSRADG